MQACILVAVPVYTTTAEWNELAEAYVWVQGAIILARHILHSERAIVVDVHAGEHLRDQLRAALVHLGPDTSQELIKGDVAGAVSIKRAEQRLAVRLLQVHTGFPQSLLELQHTASSSLCCWCMHACTLALPQLVKKYPTLVTRSPQSIDTCGSRTVEGQLSRAQNRLSIIRFLF